MDSHKSHRIPNLNNVLCKPERQANWLIQLLLGAMLCSSHHQGHTDYSQMAVRHLTACQYCQLRTRFIQSIVKTLSHKVPLSKDSQICFHHSTASNGTVVIWYMRYFLNHKFLTYMSSFHHIWKMEMVNKKLTFQILCFPHYLTGSQYNDEVAEVLHI